MPLWDEYISLERGEDLATLGGFVSKQVVGEIGASGLGITDTLVHAPGQARIRDADRLFQLLVDHEIGYRLEDVDEYGDQIVRPWRRIDREGGTCLDLAVLACAQLRHAQLRPYLVVDYDSSNCAHAFVLVNLVQPFRPGEGVWPVGTLETVVESAAAQWRVPSSLDSGQWIAYDPTEACVGRSCDFTTSQNLAWQRLQEEKHETWIVDIAASSSDRVQDRALPSSDTPGLLSRRCPPMPETINFPSRVETRQIVENGAGTTVLIGSRGSGKSTIALRAITKATRGAGWFLNGSSKQALMSALAEQEGFERGTLDSWISFDLDGYARAGLRRLATITGPWTVVIDNADLEVARIEELLPHPDPAKHQHLIITTTDRTVADSPAGWHEWGTRRQGRHVVDLQPLSIAEVRGALNEAAGVNVIGPDELADNMRRPLALRAVQCLIRHGNFDAVRRVISAENTEAVHWAEILTSLDAQVDLLKMARQVAALPPAPIPLRLATQVTSDAPNHLDQLEKLGLLRRAGATWSMHGLHASAIRNDGLHDAAVGPDIVRMIKFPAITEHLRQHYDYPTITALARAIEKTQMVEGGVALAELGDVIDERGTALEARNMARRALKRLPATGFNHIRSACFLAEARYVNQHTQAAAKEANRPQLEIVQNALDQAEQAERLAADAAQGAKATAMRGLLTKRLAVTGDLPDGERVALLRESDRLIDEALKAREDLFDGDDDHPQLAKARFNVCGVSIELAKADPQLSSPSLERAMKRYRQVEETRRHLYGEGPHRHIASCTAGAATVSFYQALLVAEDAEEARSYLYEATNDAISSLRDRVIVEGDEDGQDVVKSLRILSKILLTRLMLATGGDDALWNETEGTELGLMPELRQELAPFVKRVVSPQSALGSTR
jgi:hypothetical protein